MPSDYTFNDLTQTFTSTEPALTYEARNAAGNTPRTQTMSGTESEFTTLPRLAVVTDNTIMTNAEILTELDRLVATYVVTQSTYGTSVQGRDLRILKTTNVGKPILLITCGIHGDETSSLRGWFNAVEWLLSSTSDFALSFRTNWNLYFVPIVNPDGLNANSRRNANNINLNRNFAYFWDVATDTDKGSAALSEPETSSLVTALTPDYANITTVIDIHDWSSQTVNGFLTEQIYHSINTMRLQRSFLGFMNSQLKTVDYSIIGNLEWIESRSKRKPYLYNHFRQYGADDCYGGILEFPEVESVSARCNLAQDAFIAIISTCTNYTLDNQSGTVVESDTPPLALNSNPNVITWHSTDPRPSYYSKSGLVLSQYTDPDIDVTNTGVKSVKPDEFNLLKDVSRVPYFSKLKSSGFKEMWFFGGRTTSGTAEDDMRYVDGEAGTQTWVGNLPAARYDSAAATDGTTAFIAGGYNTGYYDDVISATLSTTSMTFSTFVSKLIITGGLQRCSAQVWGNKLLVIGGRNSGSYLKEVVAIDLTTKEQYTICKMPNNRGWLTSMMDTNTLYTFGGWNGSSYRKEVYKTALVDNKIGSASDGITEESGGVTTGKFSSSSYTFTAGNVGDLITIQATSGVFPVQAAEYTIATYIDANNVTLSTLPTYSTGANTSLAFTVTTAAPTMTTTTALTETASRQFIDVKTGSPNKVYLHGGYNGTALSTLTSYTLEATPVVATVAYTMDTYTDPETGVVTSIEIPKLYAGAGYYSSEKNSFVMMGGQDETAAYRKEVYEIFLSNNLATMWESPTNTYGYMRISSAFTVTSGTEMMIAVQVKDLTPTSIKDKNPYVRIIANFGPLSGYTRTVRTFYIVPPRDEYMTLIMPIDVRAGETELRVYLRHYTAGTDIAISSFQLFTAREQLTYPASYASGSRSVDNLSHALDVDVNDTEDGYIVGGSFIPLTAVNTNVANVKFLSFQDETDTEILSLEQSGTASLTDNAVNDHTLRCQYSPTSYDTTVTAFNTNYNRSSGKELRLDPVHWRLVDDNADELKLILSSYGETKTFTMPSTTKWNLKKIVNTSGIHNTNGLSLNSFKVSQNARTQIRALNKDQAVLILVTINDGTGTPLRLVNNIKDVVSRTNTFTAFPMSIDVSPDDGDTLQTVQLTIDNASLEMVDWVRTLTNPVPVIIETVFSGSLDTVELSLTNLVIRNIKYNTTSITANLMADDDLNQQIPSDTYNSYDFAGLF